MIDAQMNPAVFPWDTGLDSALRSVRIVDPLRDPNAYPLELDNQTLLIELGTVYGREGSDYQNPYVWQGRGVLNYPDPRVPYLIPKWGVGGAQTMDDVRGNIQATSGLLEVPT